MITDEELAAAADMPPDDLPAPVPGWWEVMGAIAALIPLLVSISTTEVTRVDGHTSVVYRDYFAIVAGGCAAVAGIVSFRAARHPGAAGPTLRLVVAFALFAAGAYHLLHGFGVVGVP